MHETKQQSLIWKSKCNKDKALKLINSKFDCKKTFFYVDSECMKTVSDLFECFSKSMDFPDYYGHNTGAFMECVTDMSWLISDSYFVIIESAEKLLSNEPYEIEWFLKKCSDISEEWSKPIQLGEAWDRPGKPFGFLFLFSDNSFANNVSFKNIHFLEGD